MSFSFSPMDPVSAQAISTWRYDPPYELYNVAPERVEEEVRALLDPQNAYYVMIDERGNLVANCCFGRDAQVSGGDYTADALDIGLGVRPDQTGQGRGHTYVDAVLEFARHTYAPAAFRVTVASFNRRALRVWERAGFRPVQEFARTRDGLPFVVLTCTSSPSAPTPSPFQGEGRGEGNPDRLIYPLTFEPVFRDYIWGGRALATLLGRALPPGIVAESWEISGHPSSPTRVASGPLAGQTLPQVQERLGDALVGTRSRWAADRGRFPLLVKLLDANQRLSVQVHPPDAYALAHEKGDLGKTEMWYVLHARPGAELIYGLAQHTTPDEFRAALERGTLDELLYHLPIQAGDAIFVPAGALHALLEGVIVAEIQQNSDTTYRVYDWGRVGTDGQPRPLHIDKALAVIDFDMVRPGTYAPRRVAQEGGLRRTEISRCPYFVVERVELDHASYQGCCAGETFEIWGCIAGQAQVRWGGAGSDRPSVSLPAVQFALLPATLGEFAVQAREPAVLLRAFTPPAEQV